MYRNGHWFASLVFGVVILGALPFYVRSTHCRPLAHHQGSICSESVGPTPFGRAFMPDLSGPLGSWSTLYWAIAIAVGFAAVVGYYHLRARKVGVQGRLWPAVVAGLVILGLVLWLGRTADGLVDFRGTSVLVVIAISLLVLSALERSRPFVLFSAGFCGLAVLSCLYTVVNLFQRLGIGRPFSGDGALPNLVLPGAYLVIGGLAFLLARPWKLHVQVHIARTTP
jgi:hypothetical protein